MSKILDEKMEKMSKEESELWALRHTAEHVLHTAMQNLYPHLKKAMGPATKEGFYFDFDLDEKIGEADFPKIEKEMQRLIDANYSMVQEYISVAEAKKIFKNNPYKMDWVEQIEKRGEKVSVYKMGGVDLDLCSGPHVKSTGEIKAFKLISVAGAYWHGDEKNKMLQRIYGTCFPSKDELEKYLVYIQEAEKRDHRKLGQELDLFSTNPLTGAGLILWHPKLARSRNIVEQFWREEHYKRGYQLVFTPHIASMDMFVKSRHLSKYINYMFPIMLHDYIEGESAPDYHVEEVLKPMNCPNHIQIFKSSPRSYRELPMRIGELGTVYRYERAGVLHGMTRVRGFTQDDSHIFCSADQVVDEVRGILRLTKYVYDLFGFKDFQAYIATRPEKYLGSLEMWDFAQKSLQRALEEEGMDYKIDEGEGVFYGPKIDSKIKDSLGREWQMGTIQFDFNQPANAESTDEDVEEFWNLKAFKKIFKTKDNVAKYVKKMGRGFDINFINSKGGKEQAVMIHRVVFGSMERFFGILIEHYGGAFPTWLSPVQVQVIPIADRHLDFAKKVKEVLENQNIRVEIDQRPEKMQAKIRDGQNQKVPYMLIVGDREEKENKVAVRVRNKGDIGQMDVKEFSDKIVKEIADKSLSLSI
ncbi:MAG: threonine--tRNA ligase [Patescibacteria group bacterium]|nr:threonine--tRNA ligase [Patescibacteria group bacterium]